MASTVGTVQLKLEFDKKSVSNSQATAQATIEKGWSKTGAAIAGVLTNAISSAMNKIGKSIGSAVERIDTLAQFPKVLQNFGVSAEEAAASTERIRDSVLGLPTSLDDAISGVQQLYMTIGDLEESEKLFSAVNDAAIVFAGGSSEAISNFIYGYKQALASGIVRAEEFNQMNEAIPGLMNKVAETMGVNAAQLKEGLSSGAISIDQFNNALKVLDTEGVGSMTAMSEAAFAASGGIQTSIQLMESAIERGIAAIIESIGTENLKAIFEWIGSAFEALGKTIADIIIFIQSNSGWIGPLAAALAAMAVAIIAINSAMSIWKAATTALTAVQAAFNVVMNANPIFLLVTVIAAITAAIAWFLTQTEIGQQILQGFGEAVSAVFTWIGSVFQEVGDWIGSVCQQIGDAFSALGAWINSVFQGVWDFVTGIFNGIGAFFQGVWNVIVNVFTSVGTAIGEAVSGAFRSVVNGVLGFIENFVNTPINLLNGFIGLINDAFGFIGVNIGYIETISLPRLAQGGITSGATAAVIGEAGQEAVLPLERNTGNWSGLLADTLLDAMEERGGGGRGEIIINQTNYINNELDADDIGRRMMTSIRRSAI